MPQIRRGQQEIAAESWGGYVEQQIREAQARGEFDNLPGAGKPLDLGSESPYGAEWDLAFRLVKNAGAAPLWIELDKEIQADAQALDALLTRTAAYVAKVRERLNAAPSTTLPRPSRSSAGTAERAGWWARLTGGRPKRRPGRPATEETPIALEAERLRARALYLARAGELDQKIRQYNAEKPRNLTWLEKVRLLPEEAAARFDAVCPPVAAAAPAAAAAPPTEGAG